MAARAAVIAAGGGNSSKDGSHGCFAKGVRMNYTYADKTYELEEVVESGSFAVRSRGRPLAAAHGGGGWWPGPGGECGWLCGASE